MSSLKHIHSYLKSAAASDIVFQVQRQTPNLSMLRCSVRLFLSDCTQITKFKLKHLSVDSVCNCRVCFLPRNARQAVIPHGNTSGRLSLAK